MINSKLFKLIQKYREKAQGATYTFCPEAYSGVDVQKAYSHGLLIINKLQAENKKLEIENNKLLLGKHIKKPLFCKLGLHRFVPAFYESGLLIKECSNCDCTKTIMTTKRNFDTVPPPKRLFSGVNDYYKTSYQATNWTEDKVPPITNSPVAAPKLEVVTNKKKINKPNKKTKTKLRLVK